MAKKNFCENLFAAQGFDDTRVFDPLKKEKRAHVIDGLDLVSHTETAFQF